MVLQYPGEALLNTAQATGAFTRKQGPMAAFGEGLATGIPAGVNSAINSMAENQKQWAQFAKEMLDNYDVKKIGADGTPVDVTGDEMMQVYKNIMQTKQVPAGIKITRKNPNTEQIIYTLDKNKGQLIDTGKRYMGTKPMVEDYRFKPTEGLDTFKKKEEIKAGLRTTKAGANNSEIYKNLNMDLNANKTKQSKLASDMKPYEKEMDVESLQGDATYQKLKTQKNQVDLKVRSIEDELEKLRSNIGSAQQAPIAQPPTTPQGDTKIIERINALKKSGWDRQSMIKALQELGIDASIYEQYMR